MDADLRDYLAAEKQRTVQAVTNFYSVKQSQIESSPEDFTYMMSQLRDYSLLGGKWIRPLLVRLAYELSGGKDTSSILNGSAALELFHRYILIHDDIIDQDELRHGSPTLEHSYRHYFKATFDTQLQASTDIYGRGMAIVAGDLLNLITYQLIIESGFEPRTISQAITAFNGCMANTIAGWASETNLKYTKMHAVSEEKILQTMTLVSAHYSVLWPLRIGQVFADISPKQFSDQLETYGTHVGLAFQIQDDILGLFGDQQTTGKPVGSDIREGKKTLLLWHAYNHGSSQQKDFIDSLLNQSVTIDELEQLRAILRESGSLDYARGTAKKHCDMGIAALKKIPIADPATQQAVNRLEQLANYLITRSL